MNIFFLFYTLNIFSIVSYENRNEILFKTLSQSMRLETRVNFNILNMAKYEHKNIVERLHHKSILIKQSLLDKKLTNRRKMDMMFSRYARMIRNIHHKSEINLDILENNRIIVSDNLSQLKKDHNNTMYRLIKIDNMTQDIYNKKLDKHMDDMTLYYKKYKEKREAIQDIIKNI